MEEYYTQLIKKTTNPKFKRYYLKMLEDIHKPKKIKKKQKWQRVFVGSLNKEFRSTTAASRALGKNRDYVRRVLLNKFPNKYDVQQIN